MAPIVPIVPIVPRGANSTTKARLWRLAAGGTEPRDDELATEEPLEIRLRWSNGERTVAVTMRTPGADFELAAGFLHGEGVVGRREEIAGMVRPAVVPDAANAAHAADSPGGGGGLRIAPSGLGEDQSEPPEDPNVVEVDLGDVPAPELATLERHFFASSACGVCGKAGLETLRLRVPGTLPAGPVLAPELLYQLPARLEGAQGLFAATGGLHAAALFDAAGQLIAVREDVGRHNALDKLVGWALLEGRLPFHDHVVLVSGRSSFEILQKCLVAGVPVVCSVSAPSSLAVDLARRFGVTLVGFLRGGRCNVYSGLERLGVAAPASPLPVILTQR
jgi:FdhD protein